MKRLFLLICLIAAAALCFLPILCFGQSTGDYLFQKKSASGALTPAWITPQNGKVFGIAGGELEMVTPSGGTWGSITGTLSAQTDLASALLLKAPLASPTFTGTVTIPSGASISGYATTSAVASGYQPLNAGLTAWNDTATTAFGRGLLAAADAGEFNLALGLGLNDAVEFGSVVVNGTVNATNYTGSGADLTDLPIDLTSGTVIGPLPLVHGGTGVAFTDPGADRLLFWDDSAGSMSWLTAGSGLSITGTTITATGTGTVTSVGLTGGDGITVTGASPITTSGTWTLGVSPATLKTTLSLGNVENTALSTWAGNTNITQTGMVTMGTGSTRTTFTATSNGVNMGANTGAAFRYAYASGADTVTLSAWAIGGGYVWVRGPDGGTGNSNRQGYSLRLAPGDNLGNGAAAGVSLWAAPTGPSSGTAATAPIRVLDVEAPEAARGQVRINGTSGPVWTSGTGSPESVITAPVGSIFSRTDGGTSTSLYVKESGSGNTGWVAK